MCCWSFVSFFSCHKIDSCYYLRHFVCYRYDICYKLLLLRHFVCYRYDICYKLLLLRHFVCYRYDICYKLLVLCYFVCYRYDIRYNKVLDSSFRGLRSPSRCVTELSSSQCLLVTILIFWCLFYTEMVVVGYT